MRAWEQNIRTVVPYVPGEQPQHADIIKLNTNENPYPPAPGVSSALETLDPDLLRDGSDGGDCRLLWDENGTGICRRRFGRCTGNGVSDMFLFDGTDFVSGYYVLVL